ncbi:MAG TPA: adenylate/guanylate cyclase domain-containing protein [Roseimicrobium sp.]|nr:adenylate/guanylate cyclase domain-containing protein [Roseimicrobium sp.]
MNAWLETTFGDRIPIIGNCSMGRDPVNTLVLAGHQVSRRHAMIHLQGGEEYWLVDLGSRNGISKNGHRVTQPVALKDSDRLEIGGNTLVFHQTLTPTTPGSLKQETSTDERTVPAMRTAHHWLLLADIQDFTPLSQRIPGDQLAKLVGGWIASCKGIVETVDGDINQYLGDGFLAYWPSPQSPASKITTAVRQLEELRAKGTLKFRIILHYGAITVDSALHTGKNSLIGPEVNFIFRMEKIAGGLGVECMATAGAAKELQGLGELTPLGEHTLKGFEGTHPAFAFKVK